uniref:RNA helicase n=1 Tax=Mola mola TaxID=94237 RepID=A0A3Q3WG79_MOLML
APLVSDKKGVHITPDHRFVKHKLCLRVIKCERYMVNLKVENNGAETVHFTGFLPLYKLEYFTLMDELKVTKTKPLCLKSGDSYEVQINFCCRMAGFYPATLAFEFKLDLQTSSAFYSVCFIEAQWTSVEDLPKIVDGVRPEGYHRSLNTLLNSLKQEYTSGKSVYFSDVLLRKALLKRRLSWKSYNEKFQLLLFLEEHQMNEELKRYNIPNSERQEATMTRDGVNDKLLVLKVPGLSENRPCVQQGDSLLVCPRDETHEKYRGYVHSVQLNTVKLGFSQELLDRFVDNMTFHVEFTVKRWTLRLQHRATELAVQHNLEEVLFPAVPDFYSQRAKLHKLRLFDSQLKNNPEQYRAVQHIVAGSSRPAPYVVFGPPGTGKTVTLVEAIKQIEKKQSTSHILACAPCNSAADLLWQEIVKNVHKNKFLYTHIMAPSQAYSNLKGKDIVYPAVEELMEYRIMVTTLYTAGRLVSADLPKGHFTHVFVDEAGHAIETECLIPLAGLLHAESGQVVLAGDPKQLGPIVRSHFALKYGMGLSLLERLMNDFPLYQKNEGMFNNHFVTKLLRNYRSHPAILKIPKELLYDGELQALFVLHIFQGFPVIFQEVSGVEECEANSPSFFNTDEVNMLVNYVTKLLQTHREQGLPAISPSDIGIITPYRKQVEKIHKALEKNGKDLKFKDMNSLKVGTVEQFQGQERRVILVSTVRSNPDDTHFTCSFVKNVKKFNVAVTRAKALLIVVGNSSVLKKDPWKRFIEYCKNEGGYKEVYKKKKKRSYTS